MLYCTDTANAHKNMIGFFVTLFCLSLVLGTLATTANAAQSEEPVYGGRIVITSESDLNTLDPHRQWTYHDYIAIFGIYNRLLRYEHGSPDELEPDLAAAMPEIDDEGTVYTFRLREGVRFHHGRELTAHDVKASFERYLHPDTGAFGIGYYRMIEGWQEYTTGQTDSLTGIDVLDDYTVQFTLTAPTLQFPYLLATSWASIIPVDELERLGSNFAVQAVGSGPFRVAHWHQGEELLLVRNEDYFRDNEPYLDEVLIDVGVDPSVAVMRWEREEVDLLHDRLPPADFLRVMQDPVLSERVLSQPANNIVYLVLNVVDEPIKDVRVRQAIAHAIDKERMLAAINFRGEKAKGYFPPPAPVHNPEIDYFEYNPDRARELLAEAGYPDGFDWTLVYRQGYQYSPAPMVLSIQADLEAVGIRTNLIAALSAEIIERTEQGEPHINIWPMEWPDPSATVDAAFRSDGSWNFWGFDDPEMDDLIDRAREASDLDVKYELYRQIDQKIVEEALFIPLYYPIDYVPYSAKVGGLYVPVNDSAYRIFRLWSKTGK